MVKEDSLRSEYRRSDLGTGTRGKHYAKFQEKNNIVLLSPDVAAAFPTEEAVNAALRSLISDPDSNNSNSG
jgi:hypothetical protein